MLYTGLTDTVMLKTTLISIQIPMVDLISQQTLLIIFNNEGSNRYAAAQRSTAESVVGAAKLVGEGLGQVREATVVGLNATSSVTGDAATVALGVAAVSAAAMQPEIAGPALAVSVGLSVVSTVTGLAAAVLDSSIGGAAESAQSFVPTIAGAKTEAGLKAMKVPTPFAQQAAVAVEGLAIIVEKTDDRVNGELDER